jgi:hypothetical protein
LKVVDHVLAVEEVWMMLLEAVDDALRNVARIYDDPLCACLPAKAGTGR